MALTREQKAKGKAFFDALPGKRGTDIPAEDYDVMYATANGITLPVWGRPVSPAQLQAMYDQGLTTPESIHAAFGKLPHPHAPNVTLGEYQDYAKAHQTYQEHKR
ncbi:MAG: hypothetical protein ACLQGJ_12185 [Candidatus Dormibacteria bacterium]|jgi:hypothetical protein